MFSYFYTAAYFRAMGGKKVTSRDLTEKIPPYTTRRGVNMAKTRRCKLYRTRRGGGGIYPRLAGDLVKGLRV
jgi:hypothetical protein